ncbi:MAG: hypothetical protein ABSG92_10425 [Conexivisphaerales archaeon]|jgi:hypothetical protein
MARKKKMRIGKREISKLEATLLVCLVATTTALAVVTLLQFNMGGSYSPTLSVSVASASYSINGGGQIDVSGTISGNSVTFPTNIVFNSTSDYINITVTMSNSGAGSVPFSVNAPGSNINIAGFTINGNPPTGSDSFAPGTTTLSWLLEANAGGAHPSGAWSFGPVQVTSP